MASRRSRRVRASAEREDMLVLLRTNQVAAMLAVSANTVRNWADQNILPVYSRTAGGHRQFALGDVRTLWIEQTAASEVLGG